MANNNASNPRPPQSDPALSELDQALLFVLLVHVLVPVLKHYGEYLDGVPKEILVQDF